MKKLFLLIAVLIPITVFGRIGITKQSTMVKFTGLYHTETTVTTTDNGVVYVGRITGIVVQGNLIIFMQGKTAIITIRYADITNKMGTTTPTGFAEYVINNYL